MEIISGAIKFSICQKIIEELFECDWFDVTDDAALAKHYLCELCNRSISCADLYEFFPTYLHRYLPEGRKTQDITVSPELVLSINLRFEECTVVIKEQMLLKMLIT